MKKVYHCLWIMVIFFCFISGCSSEPEPEDWENLDGFIYISGYEQNDTSTDSFYWKDGKRIPVSTKEAIEDIKIKNGKLYYTGRNAFYFANGNRFDLYGPPECDSALAYAIDIDDDENVYVVGEYAYDLNLENNDYITKGCYWVNEQRFDLQMDPEIKHTWACSISVDSDKNVYIAGFFAEDNNEPRYACYWKNGEKINLDGGSEAWDITVSNGSVYISGEEMRGNSSCYWIDGVKHSLPGDSGKTMSSITVYNNKVYIAGTMYNYNKHKPVYWVDGVEHTLPILHNEGNTFDIEVLNGDVYVLGWDIDFNGVEGKFTNGGPCYWKNGVQTFLPCNQAGWIEGVFHTTPSGMAFNQ